MKEKNLQIKEKGKEGWLLAESARKTGSEYDGWYEKDRYALQFYFSFQLLSLLKREKLQHVTKCRFINRSFADGR